MSLRLKMKCQKVAEVLSGSDPALQYELFPVYGDENKPWSKYTPSGIIQFTVTNPEAQRLKVGKEYFVDITDAEAPPQAPEGEPAT